MKSRLSLLLALVGVVVLVGVAVFLFVSDGDDADEADDTDTSLPAPPSLPPQVTGELTSEAQELLDLLDQGASGRYHATYAVEGTDAPGSGVTTIELWRDGDRSRRDSRTEVDGATGETIGIVDGDAAVACRRTGDEPFVCEEAEQPEAVGSDVAGSVRDQLLGATVTPRDDEIDGREVRCFGYATEDGPAELCVTADGVVVKLGTESTSLRLTELDDDVPGDVFEPPAEVTAPAEG